MPRKATRPVFVFGHTIYFPIEIDMTTPADVYCLDGHSNSLRMERRYAKGEGGNARAHEALFSCGDPCLISMVVIGVIANSSADRAFV